MYLGICFVSLCFTFSFLFCMICFYHVIVVTHLFCFFLLGIVVGEATETEVYKTLL